jgi:glycosyltransferase involved in cell wall biosynthesis
VNITYVITRAHPIGGAQIHVRDLAVSLQAQGHTCSVVTGGTGLFVDMLRAERVPTTILRHLILPIHPVHDALALREIHRALATIRPDLVAAHSSKAGILSRIAARMLGIPVILTAHGWNFTPGIASAPAYMFRQFERWAGPLTSKIIAVSEYDRQLALQAGIVAEKKVVTVYNGMGDVGPELRAHPGQTPVRLVMVARFGAQKDHPTLLRALAGLQDHPWELDLVGEGPLMGQMKALAASLGIGGRVRFLGQRMDVDQLLAGAQAGVLATNWEGFPLSILESMRAGLPVVASSVGGIGEAIRDGDTGYLVPRGDVEALRDRLGRLLTAPELRARMGSSGRALFEEQFTLDRSVHKTLDVYQDVIARWRAARPGANGMPRKEAW